MIESAVVTALVAALAVAGVLLPLVPAEAIVETGIALIAAGTLFGLPTGCWYHVRLWAVLAPLDALPAGWWIRPASLHPRIPSDQRSSVLRWFYVGGLGFFAIVLGCFAVAAGVLMEAHRSGAF